MAKPDIGTIFSVVEETLLQDPDGNSYGNLLPGLSYRVTPRNRTFVGQLMDAGVARVGKATPKEQEAAQAKLNPGFGVGAGRARATGRAATG